MRIDSYKAGGERRRARHHVATKPDQDWSIRVQTAHPPAADDCVQLTTTGLDGRAYVVTLDRADVALVLSRACEEWGQHPAELVYGNAPTPPGKVLRTRILWPGSPIGRLYGYD